MGELFICVIHVQGLLATCVLYVRCLPILILDAIKWRYFGCECFIQLMARYSELSSCLRSFLNVALLEVVLCKHFYMEERSIDTSRPQTVS